MTDKFTIAGITDFNKIQYSFSSRETIWSPDQIKVFDGEREIPSEYITNIGVKSSFGVITLTERLDITRKYTLRIDGIGERTVVPTSVFDTEEFAALYHYDGGDLGAHIEKNRTVFKLWAPTASKVVLNLFDKGEGGKARMSVPMTRGDKGVWTERISCSHGTYYTYSVTTALGTAEAVDPYARTVGVGGKRGMVVDLSKTDPKGWDEDLEFSTGISKYTDAVIWEVHIRDFSNRIEDSAYKGKYLAFTERGLVNRDGIPVGVDHLVDMGITHVHLLPAFDYATVDEKNPDNGFNWGYDPQNYNAPEGSYSTDPYHGEVRIKEFKQMVKGLHDAGVGVVMDVVYNHTYESDGAFHKIVPYYYYRYTSAGMNMNASGCGNDTASERYMYGKFMVESLKYWLREYHLDGFRFDLMGLHDLATMKRIEHAVHAINPEALIYGEGWDMGTTIDGSPRATQYNIAGISASYGAVGAVAVFNDVMRDGLKGSAFYRGSRGYINGAPYEGVHRVKFGMLGGMAYGYGWGVADAAVVNYMSAHDNHTLWDKLALANADYDIETRVKMVKLGAAIIMLSRGIPFMQAGEEMLRSKDGDENSYRSSDEINNIRWEALKKGSAALSTYEYYRGLIKMRRAHRVFRSDGKVNLGFNEFHGGALAVYFDSTYDKALAIINPHSEPIDYIVDGSWGLIADGFRAGADIIEWHSGNVTVAPYSVNIYVR